MKKRYILFFYLLFSAMVADAQTGGPGQPEFMQFKPVTAADLVNLSNGTFSYNLPLFQIGGYPVNISYQSGAGMDDVASTVGLGWNLNIGAITHTMRGLPDDFKGDVVTRTIYMRPNITMGGNFNLGLEIVGFPVGASAGMGMFYNTYNGFGLERNFGLNFSVSNASNTQSAGLSLGMKSNSMNGVDVYAQPSVSLSSSKTNDMSAHGSLGGVISVNSREGLKGSVNASMSLSSNINYQPAKMVKKDDKMVKEADGEPKTMSESLAGFSANYSFSKTAEIPRVTYPYNTTAYSGSIKVGAEIYFMHPNLTLSGYYTRQDLSTHTISSPAYGFLYAEKAFNAGPNVLQDFNREKDQPYVKDVSKNIGIPFYTNDIYSVNAQGITGSFQLDRNDIGVIFDNRVVSSSTSLNIGLEAGIGNAFHVGADVSSTSTTSSSGKWSTSTTTNLDFQAQTINNVYQPAYFKNASDVSVDVNGFYDRLKTDNAIKVSLHSAGATSVAMDNYLFDRNNAHVSTASQVYKAERDPRTINIQYLTAAEAAVNGIDKTLNQYEVNQFSCRYPTYQTAVARTDANGYRKPHHISEITATNIDGMRYVFGLPTYNITQEEISYTLPGGETVDANGLVPYNPATAWGTNGKDGFYEKTETPAYVTSNLLTEVLSPDYIDVDNNGPSENDIGNYVKFNYTFAGVFNWRTPYQSDKATYNKAFLSDDTDNKASIVSGTKELWYIHSIESKTEVAEFYYDTNRLDGLGAVDNKKLYRLIEIKVYSKNERISQGNLAVPIRIVQLTQNYDLCPDTKNSAAASKGKLTLNQVAMYSGKSMRELQSPYKFTYGQMPDGTVINRHYDPHMLNRWGNYQENNNTDITASSAAIGNPGSLSNGDFPYSSQDTAAMRENAYNWNLTKIHLPGGGDIKVDYEPHHYAYTQDQRNMEMVPIEGFGASATLATSSQLYSGATSNIFLRFKLQSSITGADAQAQLLYQYFNVTAQNPNQDLPGFLYYKTLIRLREGRENTWEWVTGYATIKSAGLIDPYFAYIELKPVCINDQTDNGCPLINPMAKNAFQFMRLNRPGLCYGAFESQLLPESVTLEDFLNTHDLSDKVHDQSTAFFQGFNKYAQANNFANDVALNKSFIRLYTPNMDKIIGGSRVRTVTTTDNWDLLTADYGTPLPTGKSYTTDYEYTTTIKNPVNNQDQAISSGVTEYEPFLGGDENPLHQPSFYDEHIKLALDNNLFVELPYDESLYPGANLIYSKVKVTSNKTTLQVPGSGYQEYEFFTAKDYPVKTDYTEIGDNYEKKTSILQGLLSSVLGVGEFHDYVTISQGFSVVLNDMHGKDKSTKNFNSQGTLVSSQAYDYALNKTQNLAKRDGTVYASDKLGVSVSAICDSRNTEHSTVMTGVDLNLDFTILAIVPSFMIVPLPKSTVENTRLNSVAFNKIVYKKGIQTKKTVTENGSSVSTENLVFDETTGSTLLTRTTNEFNDPLYSFHYPAHWIYSGLGAGYASAGINLSVTASNTISFSGFDGLNVLNALNTGDELADNAGHHLWITAKSVSSVTVQPQIMGTPPVVGTYTVLHPGRKNLINQEAGTVVTNYYPVRLGKFYFAANADSTGIINSSVKEYADNRIKPCNCDTIKGSTPTTTQGLSNGNPYLTGELGNWYPVKTWAYLTGRTRSLNMSDNQTNIRKDGIYKAYTSFFKPPASGNGAWTTDPTNWQWVETVSAKDVSGLTLETRDVLGRFNAMRTGYKQQVIVAEAGNAQQHEIMFDGFEDWYYSPMASACDKTNICQPQQINWAGVFSASQEMAHTGKYSGRLMANAGVVTVPLYISCDIVIRPIPMDVKSLDLAKIRDAEVAVRRTIPMPCCTGMFKPIPGKKYIISAWVREVGNPLAYTFTGPSIKVDNTTFNTSGNIIDGWQRIYGEFIVPANATSLSLKFNKGNTQTYFDDIRILPVNAKMTTYVYDQNTLKLTFTNDENNYFTKYNYDGEDNLQSINKETEQGVQTIKEARSLTHKKL